MTPWRSLVIELWISGGLGDSRGAESGVSWTRFDTHPTLKVAICQMQDIFCIGNRVPANVVEELSLPSAVADGNAEGVR